MASIGQVNKLALVVVIVSILAVGLVAGTIGSVVMYEIGDDGEPQDVPGEGIGAFEPDADPGVDDEEGEGGGTSAIDLVFCFPFLQQPVTILGIIGGMVGILYLTYLRFNLATSLLVGSFLIPVTMLLYFFFTNCPPTNGGGGPGFGGYEALEQSREGIDAVPAIPPSVAAVFLAGMMIVAVVLLFSMTSREETFEPPEEPELEPDAADFARAAGRAAERIEEANVAVDNAVYQAWLEMTGLLSLDNPKSLAPQEFAEAAIEVGLAADDVYELTDLFNEVRYGGKDAETREERAIATLRNIEKTYQEEVGDQGDAE